MLQLLRIIGILCPLVIFSQQILKPSDEYIGTSSVIPAGGNIGGLGDINKDGFDDFYINNGDIVHICYGNSLGKFAPALTLPYANYSHGDINGDGIEDVVSAYNYTIRTYLGSSVGIKTVPNYEFTDASNYFTSLDASGDINNDGFNDVVIGQPTVSLGNSIYGKALVFMGSTSGIKSNPDAFFTTIFGAIGYATKVAYLGDVNHDGFDDLGVIALALPTVTQLTSNFMDVYLGSKNGLNKQANFQMILGKFMDIAAAGDINSDGYEDVMISQVSSTNNQSSVAIYAGGNKGLTMDKLFDINEGTDRIGVSLGDFNDDKYSDIAVSDPTYSGGQYLSSGKAEVFLGNGAGINDTAAFIYIGSNTSARAGRLASIGDINKDGFTDLLVGQNLGSHFSMGSAVILLGKATIQAGFSILKRNACRNYAVAFQNTSSKDALNFIWDFGDGTSTTERSPKHVYGNAGTYYISLKSYDSFGHMASYRDSLKVAGPLTAGNYSISQTGTASFQNIEAFNEAIHCGIEGNISVALDSGNYRSRLVFDSLDVYNSASPYSIHLWAKQPSPAQTIIAVGKISKSSHIKLSGITFLDTLHNNLSYFGGVAKLHISNASDVAIEKCRLSDYTAGLLRIDSSSHITLTNSQLYIKQWLSYGLVGKKNKDIKILDNDFSVGEHAIYGLQMDSSENVSIVNNQIYARSALIEGGWIETAVLLQDVKGLNLQRNTIFNARQALVLSHCTGRENMNLIANNAIGETVGYNIGNGQSHAVYVDKCFNFKIYHNTISSHIPNGISNSIAQHTLFVSGDSIDIKNNILKSKGENTGCLYIQKDATDLITSDYNFFSGNVTIIWSNQSSKTLEGWQKVYETDYNSIQGDMAFQSDDKLIPVSHLTLLNEAAFALPEVSTDIELKTRGKSTTDMGAYELQADTSFSYALHPNIRLLQIITDSLALGENDIQAVVTNDRNLTVDSLLFTYQIDNGSTIVEKWVGKLLPKDTLVYTFKQRFGIVRGRLYPIKMDILIGKDRLDAIPTNNTLSKDLRARMEGAYTIHGANADFQHLKEANRHLGKSGVVKNAKVTFLIYHREEIDTLQLENGPVEYRGVDSKVAVKFTGGKEKADITIKNLTIHPFDPYSPNISRQYSLIDKCSNLTIDSCLIKPFSNYYIHANGAWIRAYEGALDFRPRSENIKISNSEFKNFDIAIHFSNVDSWGGHMGFTGHNSISGCIFDSIGYAILTDANMLQSPQDSLVIDHNVMTNTWYSVTFVRASANLRLNDNVLQGRMSGDWLFGSKIYHNKINGNTELAVHPNSSHKNTVFNNKITGHFHIRGADVDLYNNFIIGDIHLNKEGNNYHFYNNTVKGSVSISNSIPNNKLKFYNNVCYNDSNYVISVIGSLYEGRHNNYFRRDGGFLAYYHDTTYSGHVKDIDELNTTDQESYSISVDPMFVSESDLHSTSALLIGRGAPFNDLAFDIDYKSRSAVSSDIGANIVEGQPVFVKPHVRKTLPANLATGIDINTVITIVFDRKISLDTGHVAIWDYDTEQLHQKIGSNNLSRSDSNSILAILSKPLQQGHQYYVTLSSNLVYHMTVGNDEVSDKSFLSFTTTNRSIEVNTLSIMSIHANAVQVKGSVIGTGNLQEKGICIGAWGSTSYMTTRSYTNYGFGEYTIDIGGLNASNKYWARAYCIINNDTIFGPALIFNMKTLGSDDVQVSNDEQMVLYPNPVDHLLQISSFTKESFEVVLFHATGAEVNHFTMDGEGHIDVSDLTPGFYHLKITTKDHIYYKTVIKKRLL